MKNKKAIKIVKVKRDYPHKNGEWVHKEYSYAKEVSPSLKGKKGTKITTRQGKVSLKFARQTKDLSVLEREAVHQYARAAAAEMIVVTLEQALAHIRDPKNKILRFLANMGVTIEDIIDELWTKRHITVDEAWLNDSSHWVFITDEDAIIILPNGQEAYFVFQYTSQDFNIDLIA